MEVDDKKNKKKDKTNEKEVDPRVNKLINDGGDFPQYDVFFRSFIDTAYKEKWTIFEAAETDFHTFYTNTLGQISYDHLGKIVSITENMLTLQELFWLLCTIYVNSVTSGEEPEQLGFLSTAFDRILYLKAFYNVLSYDPANPTARIAIPHAEKPTPPLYMTVHLFSCHSFNDFYSKYIDPKTRIKY
jgi:hypothetical protein